jgi:hypothetical protein
VGVLQRGTFAATETTATATTTALGLLDTGSIVRAVASRTRAEAEADVGFYTAQDLSFATTLPEALVAGDIATAVLSVSAALTEKNVTAQALADSVAAKTSADARLARAQAVEDTLADVDMLALRAASAVAAYLQKETEEAKAAFELAETTAQGQATAALAASEFAAATVADATPNGLFLAGVAERAAQQKEDYRLDAVDAAAASAEAAASVVTLTARRDAAVATCKGAGYARAQAAARAAAELAADDLSRAASVKTDYALKSTPPADGSAGTICAYPAKAADAAQEPRPICNDLLCCGAAQKFLKDGTKLSVETCQTEIGARTYTYWPPLPADAVVEPTPETWRFQCLAGAQKLVAAATAALAASYMMA